MRIDKFLSCVNIVKKRSISDDMIAHDIVMINDLVVKKARQVKIGDIITINYLEKVDKFKILDIPTMKSTPKSAQDKYITKI